jgi:hypothetical protein
MHKIRLLALAAFSILVSFTMDLPAMPGKVILKNGNNFKGDVQKLPDGGCWLTMKLGSIKFEADEIQKIIIYSSKDTVRANFEKSFTKTKNVLPATPYEQIINRSAMECHVDPALVKAVIKVESNFDPMSISHAGARGLMQLMPGTAKILGVKNILSPEENIRAGTRYLRDMLYLFEGDLSMALAAYNAGPAKVNYYCAVPPYKETRDYLRSVGSYYKRYRGENTIFSTTDEKGCLNFCNVR